MLNHPARRIAALLVVPMALPLVATLPACSPSASSDTEADAQTEAQTEAQTDSAAEASGAAQADAVPSPAVADAAEPVADADMPADTAADTAADTTSASPAAVEPAAAPATPPAAANAVALFNGSDLSGFKTINGDLNAWGVVDGEIRVIHPGRGGWLRTGKMYRDFELSLDFIIPEGGNSGVGLRCTSMGDPAFTGFEVQIFDSHGKGVGREQAGAVYNAIPPATQAINPAGEWNSYRIRVEGDTLNVWLNDEWVQQDQKLDDRGIFRNDSQPLPLNERATTGYIAFQDHGEGGLRLRNIRVADLSPDPDPGDFIDAFNGRDLSGWTHRGNGSFVFENGTLVALDGGPGHLFSNAMHTDIEIRTLVRFALPEETGANRPGNSGIYFRTVPRAGDPDTWPLGYEAQLDNHDPDETHYTGCLYDVAGAQSGGPITEDGEWFDYRIMAVGDRIRTWINGRPMVDTINDVHSEGMIAIQTHHPGNRVEFRDFRWRVPNPGEID